MLVQKGKEDGVVNQSHIDNVRYSTPHGYDKSNATRGDNFFLSDKIRLSGDEGDRKKHYPIPLGGKSD